MLHSPDQNRCPLTRRCWKLTDITVACIRSVSDPWLCENANREGKNLLLRSSAAVQYAPRALSWLQRNTFLRVYSALRFYGQTLNGHPIGTAIVADPSSHVLSKIKRNNGPLSLWDCMVRNILTVIPFFDAARHSSAEHEAHQFRCDNRRWCTTILRTIRSRWISIATTRSMPSVQQVHAIIPNVKTRAEHRKQAEPSGAGRYASAHALFEDWP